MNSLIFSLAPLGGLATALPAIVAAEAEAVVPPTRRPLGELRAFTPVPPGADGADRDRDGGYLLV